MKNSLMKGKTVGYCYDLLCDAINQDDEDRCDSECDSYGHTEACDERSSSASLIMRLQAKLELQSAESSRLEDALEKIQGVIDGFVDPASTLRSKDE